MLMAFLTLKLLLFIPSTRIYTLKLKNIINTFIRESNRQHISAIFVITTIIAFKHHRYMRQNQLQVAVH